MKGIYLPFTFYFGGFFLIFLIITQTVVYRLSHGHGFYFPCPDISVWSISNTWGSTSYPILIVSRVNVTFTRKKAQKVLF